MHTLNLDKLKSEFQYSVFDYTGSKVDISSFATTSLKSFRTGKLQFVYESTYYVGGDSKHVFIHLSQESETIP